MKKSVREKILIHLSEYKQDSIGMLENGKWWKNQQEYRHILPERCYAENIVNAGFRTQLLELISPSERHNGFHHLNSSQALALNLFGPFLVSGKLSALSAILGLDCIEYSWEFEHISDDKEGTNFDLYLESDNRKYFFEVKYTEDRFGSANDDVHHNRKYDLVYKNRLAGIADISKVEFFKEYQLWRNIIYQSEGTVVFVIPRFRSDLLKRIMISKTKIEPIASVLVIFVEDICRIGIAMDEPCFRDHYLEFEKKYLDKNFA